MDFQDLRIHAPCVVNDKVGVEQLEERVKLGLHPRIILKSVPGSGVVDEMQGLIEQTDGVTFSFDFGGVKGGPEDYIDRLLFIQNLNGFFGNIAVL